MRFLAHGRSLCTAETLPTSEVFPGIASPSAVVTASNEERVGSGADRVVEVSKTVMFMYDPPAAGNSYTSADYKVPSESPIGDSQSLVNALSSIRQKTSLYLLQGRQSRHAKVD